jgi:hypothetical protein
VQISPRGTGCADEFATQPDRQAALRWPRVAKAPPGGSFILLGGAAGIDLMHRLKPTLHAEVMHAVFADRDRSVEKAVEFGINAGIEFERERIRSILELSAPPGLAKAMQIYALNASTTAESAAQFIATFQVSPAQATEFRRMFRLVDHETKIEENENAG